MKVKRFVGTLATTGTLVVASFGFAGAAQAATAVQITSPGSGQVEVGTVPVRVTASCNDLLCSVSSVSAQVLDPNGVQVASQSANANSLSFNWDTTPRNGVFSVKAHATENSLGGTAGDASVGNVKVNNPPSTPSGVAVSLDPNAGNTPVVTWNQNPEPDITGYELFRSANGSAPVGVASAHDTTAPQGQSLTYFVVAVRSSPVYGSGITSCSGGAAAPCQPTLTTQGMGKSAPVTVPVPPAAAGTATQDPASIATQDPAPGAATAGSGAGAAAATGTTTPAHQPLGFTTTAPKTLAAPNLPTKIVQLPAPNVVQFAPLLPYSGKIPEVPTGGTVPAPVQAAGADSTTQSTITVPVFGKVNGVNAARFFAAAAFLIVAAVHVIRFARRLTHPVADTALGGGSAAAAATTRPGSLFSKATVTNAGSRGSRARRAARERPWESNPRGPVAPRS